MFNLLRILLLFSTLLAKISYASFLELEIGTEDYPPMNYIEDGQLKGLASDILREVWALEKIDTPPEVLLYPWARAWEELGHTPNFLLFSVAKTEPRTPDFQWACPIFEARYVLLAPKKSNIAITSAHQLSNYIIGTIRADVSEEALLDQLSHRNNVISNTLMLSNLEMLDRGRLDMIAYEQLGAAPMLRNAGRNPQDFETVFTLGESKTCFAFSKKTDKRIVSRFQQHLTNIVASGSYQKIVNRYFPDYTQAQF